MYPVPAVADLALFSGRDQATYTSYANSALLQATIRFTFLTEVTDPASFTGYNQLSQTDQQQLALNGICSLADSIYLQFPYQQVIASPLNSETVGSTNFQKTMSMGGGGSMSRMAPAALELSMATTGIPLFDMAVQLLSLRTIASGVFSGGVTAFEEGERRSKHSIGAWVEDKCGRMYVLGPEDRDNIDFPGFDTNAQSFPSDPGI
jgi:hypothetical protein